MTNVSILLRPSRLCTPELVQQQVQGFASLLGGADRFTTSGTTATVVQLALPVPVTQTSTGTPSKFGLLESYEQQEPAAIVAAHAERCRGLASACGAWFALSSPCPAAHPPPAVGVGQLGMNNVSLMCMLPSAAEKEDWSTAPRQQVANASQLLAALASQAAATNPGAGGLELSANITLDAGSIQGAGLPVTIQNGRTLVLAGELPGSFLCVFGLLG